MNDDDDIQLKSYQEDLDDNNTPDPFMNEEGEDPSEELGVPASELKDELDKNEIDDEGNLVNDNDSDVRDDEREFFEDLDKDGKDRGY